MRRNEFIKAGAGLAGLSMIRPSVFASNFDIKKISKPRIKISLKYGMVKEDMSILEKFQMLKDIGFDGVEMDSPNNLDNEEIIAAKKETGLEIPRSSKLSSLAKPNVRC